MTRIITTPYYKKTPQQLEGPVLRVLILSLETKSTKLVIEPQSRYAIGKWDIKMSLNKDATLKKLYMCNLFRHLLTPSTTDSCLA